MTNAFSPFTCNGCHLDCIYSFSLSLLTSDADHLPYDQQYWICQHSDPDSLSQPAYSDSTHPTPPRHPTDPTAQRRTTHSTMRRTSTTTYHRPSSTLQRGNTVLMGVAHYWDGSGVDGVRFEASDVLACLDYVVCAAGIFGAGVGYGG